MPAGTGARFALVVALALVTSAKMVLETAYSVTGKRLPECDLAAGIDVLRSPDRSTLVARLTQARAYTSCETRVAPPPPVWLTLGWPVLVLVVAVLAFHTDRWWHTRPSRVRPLKDFDDPTSGYFISQEVARLQGHAGVGAEVTYVVDISSEACSATVLGSTRNPVLCLHFGLVAQRQQRAADNEDDPEFRAVLLHEFAHIRYGDVSAARGTMAVWRAFVLVALLPYLITAAVLATRGPVRPGLGGINPVDTRDILISLVLAALGYLARCDVLRNREIYADRDAVLNHCAARQLWLQHRTGTLSGPRRAARGFAGLWRNHPSWDLRAASLDDLHVLFVVQAVPVFLAGVAAALIDADFQYGNVVYFVAGSWMGAPWIVQAAGALSAILITLIVGVALWRLVAYSGQEGSTAPTGPRAVVTGLRTGLWLGAGMAVGDLTAGQGTIAQLVPARPEMLLIVLAAGVGFAVWTVQCAGALLARSPGGIPRWALTAGLAGGFLALSWWFAWWTGFGSPYSTGISISPSGFLRYMKYFYGQPVVHPTILNVVSWFEFVLSELTYPPLDLLAVAAVWMIPLLAWARRGGSFAGGLPSLRTPLIWAACGAVATWACVVWAQAYMHRTQPVQPLHGLYEFSYMWLILGAQVGPAVVVAVGVGLRQNRFRLLASLVAAEATVLAGFAGVFVLVSTDGCIRPLDTLETSCSWRPGLIVWGFSTLVDVTAVVAALVAFAVCVVALAHPAARRDHGEFQAARPRSPIGSGHRKTPVFTGLAGATALGVAVAGVIMKFPQQSRYVSLANQVTASVGFGMGLSSAQQASPDPGTAALEVGYWSNLGGADLLNRLQADAARIFPVLAADYTLQHKYTVQDFLAIEPACADIVAVSQDSANYFLLPDIKAGPWWSGFTQYAGAGGHGCESAIALLPHDQLSTAFWTALNSSLKQISQAYVNTGFIAARIEALEEAGGITGYDNAIAGPPLTVLPAPAGTRGWSQTSGTGNPMDLAVAVAKLYPASDWSIEKTWLSSHEFVSAAREGWTYADGTQAAVIINRFAAPTDAASQIGTWNTYFRQESAPSPPLTDQVDGGVGTTIPASKQQSYAKTEMAAQFGVYVIEIQVYGRTPAPDIAKDLLRQQYTLLKAGGF
ncbi:M48 family metalloprotease [Catenulispora rubra]|uniref:M48 family metalloprotease n=1 Tax=Catenulispora rubra TaxID=280293 RepID=UPI00189250A8|nr:M48 family metalloprotease [Catenulispora rubra]